MKFLLIIVFILSGCSTNHMSVGFNQEYKFIDDFIEQKKKELPEKNFDSTIWVDISREKNTLIYLYQLDGLKDNLISIKDVEKKYKSEERRKSFCNMIKTNLNIDVFIETKLLNTEKKEILKTIFDSKSCQFLN